MIRRLLLRTMNSGWLSKTSDERRRPRRPSGQRSRQTRNTPRPGATLGVLRVTQGRHAEAERLFRQAVEDDPDSSHMRVNHGLAMAALGRLDHAEQAIREAMRINPAEPKARGALAVIARLRQSGLESTPGIRE